MTVQAMTVIVSVVVAMRPFETAYAQWLEQGREDAIVPPESEF